MAWGGCARETESGTRSIFLALNMIIGGQGCLVSQGRCGGVVHAWGFVSSSCPQKDSQSRSQQGRLLPSEGWSAF